MWEPGSLVLDGRFRIIGALAQGSVTEVYLAEQVSLSRKVALKIFQQGAQDATGRFEKEVGRLAAVDHPSVVRVIDSGRFENTLYLITEFAEGKSLAEELSKGEPLLPERAVELLTQIADGLASIHHKDLVHGDLRASNVLLVQGLRGEHARLLDFGVTRLVEPETPGGQVTLIGQALGPPEYLSPEQGRGARPDAASDLYGFGVLAYQVLSGTLPFKGPNAADYLTQHQHTAPVPLLEAAAHLADQFRLCDVVMRCLEKDPAKRPASALEVFQKLRALPPPAEPTLFVEAMQRPPELPAPAPAPAPPPIPAAAVAPPPLPAPPLPAPPAPAQVELLKSVQMLVLTPSPGTLDAVVIGATPAAARRWPLAVGAALVLLAVGAGGVVFLAGSTVREARGLIERRQPAQALEVIGKALRKETGAPNPKLTALRAAALHLADAHKDEATVFKNLPPGAPEALDPLVLSGVVEDFSKKEDAGLRAVLQGLSQPALHEVLEGFAQEPLSPRQWGGLRYLDLEGAKTGLNLVALYSASLESNDCSVRKTAAKRLQQLADDASESALLRLRETPREGAEKNCGQDEAAAALQALKKR